MINLVGTILQNKNGEKEKLIRVIHRHWFNVILQFVPMIALALFMLACFLVFPQSFPERWADPHFRSLFLFLESIFALFLWTFSFFVWVEYYFDVFIITDTKIVDVEQKGLFSREVSELKFERIQDVSVEVKGLIPTFLNYGNLHIQTAGEEKRFAFKAMPNPYEIKNLIMSLQKEQIREETNELGEMVRAEIKKELR